MTELVPVPRMGGLALSDDPWDQAVSAFLASKRSERTRLAYASDLRQWRLWCETRGVSPWSAQQVTVDTWTRAMEEAGLAPASTGRKLSAVASMYRYLCRTPKSPALAALGWTWLNPTENIDRPAFGGTGKTLSLTSEQLDSVLRLAMAPTQCTCRPRGHYHGLRPYVAVLLMGTLAVRARELITARRDGYVETQGQKIFTITRKGGKEGRMVLDPAVAACLDELLAASQGDYLIGTGNANADYKWLYQLSLRLGREAEIGFRVTPHVFRATFATIYLDSPSANLAWLQDQMGHAGPETTRKYDRGANALKRSADVVHTVVRQLHI